MGKFDSFEKNINAVRTLQEGAIASIEGLMMTMDAPDEVIKTVVKELKEVEECHYKTEMGLLNALKMADALVVTQAIALNLRSENE